MHDNRDETLEILISGYIDDELDADQRAELEGKMAEDPALRREVESMRRLIVGTQSALHAPSVSPDEWDRFLDHVYNRIERRTGWVVFLGGGIALALYALLLYVETPWASGLVKVLVATPVLGLALLFLSVLRQRLHNRRSDRYTQEVHR